MHTKSPHRHQLAGILRFCFTNGYLAMKHFTNPDLPHYQFKMAATNALVWYRTTSLYETRQIDTSNTHKAILHEIEKIGCSLDCYYCNHRYEKQCRKTTTFWCKNCKIAICRPSTNKCWDLRIICRIPEKKYRKPQTKNNVLILKHIQQKNTEYSVLLQLRDILEKITVMWAVILLCVTYISS